MSAKQDRVYTRTAAQLKQEMNFGESFAEVLGIATDARTAADEAKKIASSIDSNLTSEEIFNRLTNNGQSQGLYRGPDGELYINASFVVAGILASLNKVTSFNLETGILSCTDPSGNYVSLDYGELKYGNKNGESIRVGDDGFGAAVEFSQPSTGYLIGYLLGLGADFQIGCYDHEAGEVDGHTISWKKVGGVKTLVGDADNSGKKVLYEGAVTTGGLTFTVTDTADYDLFAIEIGDSSASDSVVVLGYKVGDTIRGIGGWGGDSVTAKQLYFVSATFSGDTWTLVECRKQDIWSSGSIGTGVTMYVRKVTGII